jgi:hypothetical protein
VSWTKADVRRVETAVTWVTRMASKDAETAGHPWSAAYVNRRAQLDEQLVERGLTYVIDWLREQATLAHRDGRAYPKLADKLEQLGWPPGVEGPRLRPLVVTPDPQAAELVEHEGKDAPSSPDDIRKQTQAVAVPQVLREIQLVRERGEAIVRRAPGPAFGSHWVRWETLQARQDWRDWLESGLADVHPQWELEAFRRAVRAPEGQWPARGERAVRDLWTYAWVRVGLGELDPPVILDLRGLPQTHGHLPSEWVDPMARSLQVYELGVVLLVEDNSWVLERCLPG